MVLNGSVFFRMLYSPEVCSCFVEVVASVASVTCVRSVTSVASVESVAPLGAFKTFRTDSAKPYFILIVGRFRIDILVQQSLPKTFDMWDSKASVLQCGT